MREAIRKQLMQCVFANINNYDEKTNTFFIPKYSKPKYDIGKCYLVKLPAEIVKNPNTLLASNWNNSSAPQFEYLKIYINKTIGKMVQVDSIAYDVNTKQDINIYWSGYLNIDEITQIAEL